MDKQQDPYCSDTSIQALTEQCKWPINLTVSALNCTRRRHDTKAAVNKGGSVMPSETLDRYDLQIVLMQVITRAEAVWPPILVHRGEGGHEQARFRYALRNLEWTGLIHCTDASYYS